MSQEIWPAVLGRFDWQALPFVRAWDNPTASEIVGAAAASMVVIGALFTIAIVTRYGKWKYLWSEWLTSLDHKKIGIMYVVLAFVMLTRALIEAVLMRMQQADAINSPGFIAPDHFAQLFSTHGSIMIFFMAMPFLTGLINYVTPLQIGARDVAFPLSEFDQPLAHRGRRRADDGLAGHRPLLDGRAGAAIRPIPSLAFSPDVGTRLLDLGGHAGIDRLDAHRAQFRGYHLQDARSRHASDADAACSSGPHSALRF